MSYDVVLMIDTNTTDADGARTIAEALGGSVLYEEEYSSALELPDFEGHAGVAPTRGIIPEYSHVLRIRPYGLDTIEEIDAYAREMYERLCEATPWRIGLMPDGGDIIDERPALNAG